MIHAPRYIDQPPMAFSLKEGTAQRTAFGLAVLSTATQVALAAIITRLATITPNSSPVFAATLAAVVFDFVVLIILIGIVVFSLVARSRTSRTLQLSLSATSFVLFITASVLSIYVLGWTKVDSAHTPANSQGTVLAGLVIWTINMVAQTMLHIFRSLRKREQAPSEHVESTVEPQASPRSLKRSISFPLKSLASPSSSPFLRSTFEVTSPTTSTHSVNGSTLRHSIQQAIRPITSRTKLILTHTPTPRESGSFAATRENNSLEISCRGDGFETWDTSSVEQGFVNPFVTSPTTGTRKKLEPIPGSRPVSPAKPLDGPFPLVDDEPEKQPLPDSPMQSPTQSPMRMTSANDSTDTLPVPPLLLHRNNSSSSQEAHIHPLFRSHSPTPPPTPSADTIITASPFAGQVIHGDHAMAPKRMQSARAASSQPSSPKAFTPPLRSGSFPSLRRPSNLSTRHPLELDPEDVPEMPKL